MANSAPTISGNRKNIVANEDLNLDSIVTATDDDGDPIVRYHVIASGNGKGGFLYVGTRRLAPGVQHALTAAEWAQLSFQATLRGRVAVETTFSVRAFDGTDWGAFGQAVLRTLPNANRPIVRAQAILQLDTEKTVAGTDLFEVMDEDNSTTKIYRFFDRTAGNGYFLFNGKRRNGRFQVRADKIDMVEYRTADEQARDNLEIAVYDGRFWSTNRKMIVESIGRPVLSTGHNTVLDEQEVLTIDDLFVKADKGPKYELFEIYDSDPDRRSAGFYQGIDALQPGVIHQMTPTELYNFHFEGGKFEQRSHDDILVRAYNGKRWGKWTNLTINTEPKMVEALASSSWQEFEPSRDPLVLTFSFLNRVPDYYEDGAQERNEFLALTDELREAARDALITFENVANVRFVEVPDHTEPGTITFGTADLDDTALAWAYLPNRPETDIRGLPGDIWYNTFDFPFFWLGPGNKGAGSSAFEVTLHELGHAMGLKHPFDGAPVLPRATDHSGMTNMSYTGHPENTDFFGRPLIFGETPMLYDIAALQSMYGANTEYEIGDTVWSYNRDQQVMATIWDAGGEDTIDTSNQAVGVDIDLRQGQFSSISRHFDATRGGFVASTNNVGIAYGVEIEHAVGSNFGDTITGNELENRIDGGSGRDTIRGRQGNDYLIGGRGSDTYVYQIGDGDDTIDDMAGGRDRLELHWIQNIDFETLTFRRTGNDLHIDLTLEGGPTSSEGTITIKRDVGKGRIESFQLYTNGLTNGRQVDLTSVFANANENGQNFTVTNVLGTYGYLAAPV